MSEQDGRHLAAEIGSVIFGISRGAAIALMALALYVAFTNWEGSGATWALRYFVLALVVFAVGIGIRHLLSRGQ
jgi:hypothetical protein